MQRKTQQLSTSNSMKTFQHCKSELSTYVKFVHSVCLKKYVCLCNICMSHDASRWPSSLRLNRGAPSAIPAHQSLDFYVSTGVFRDPSIQIDLKDLYMYLTPVHSPISPHHVFDMTNCSKNSELKTGTSPARTGQQSSIFCFCMPSGSGYVLTRFRPFQCTTLQVSSTPWKLNAALGFALFDNSTEMILTENEMKWQRFNVSTVSQKTYTASEETSAITSNRPEPQNDKTLNYCCYQLSLIPQS